MGKMIRGSRRGDRGAAAVEFALVMPIFFILVFGIIQYGMYFWSMQAGTAAVGDAARRMAVGECQTNASAKSLVTSRLGAANTGTVTVTQTYTKADGTTGATAPGEIGGSATLTATFDALNFNFPLLPVPNDGEVTRSATVRIEDVASSAGGCS